MPPFEEGALSDILLIYESYKLTNSASDGLLCPLRESVPPPPRRASHHISPQSIPSAHYNRFLFLEIMSIPSSPPPLPEELFNDPPSSPPLAYTSYHSRKRYADHDSSLSSDPIFSEDASEESEMNGGFRKKQKKYIKGPWFKHASSPALQRTAAANARNADSVCTWTTCFTAL